MINIFRVTNLFFLVLILVSCAVQKREGDHVVPDSLYDLTTLYDANERAFFLKFTSKSNKEICVPKMSWTDENGGHYFFGDTRIFFMSDGVRYDVKKVDYSGHCTAVKINGCVNILKNGDQIFGKLPIEDFSVPTEVYLREGFNPQLYYSYAPRFCTTKK